MTDAEKTRLLEKKRKFDSLSPEEQEQYRQLHLQLVEHPRYEHLRATLQRYYEWQRRLTPMQRAELSKKPASDRMKYVQELMDEQAKEHFKLALSESKGLHELLTGEDRDVICKWTDEFVLNHQDAILDAIPESRFFQKSAIPQLKADPQKLVFTLRFAYFRAFQASGPQPPESGRDNPSRPPNPPGTPGPPRFPDNDQQWADAWAMMPHPSADEEDDLASQLTSAEARTALKKATQEGERAGIIRSWMLAATFSRGPISPEDLNHFVDRLEDSEREWLESLPRDKMYPELRRLYFRKGGRYSRGGRRGGFGPGRDGPREDGREGPGREGPGREGSRGRGGPGRDSE